MDIHITMLNGSSRTLKVNPHDTVGSLKTRIQQQLGVPAERQKLIFKNGASTPLNDDSRTLSSYNMEPGSQVSLLITQPETQPDTQPSTFQVFLINEKGTTSTYDVTPNERVEGFKRRVEKREGVPAGQQRLIHEGHEMQTGKLSDYNVRKNSTIDLTLRLRGG